MVKNGKYYKYMVNELRNQTNKIIILDITVSIKFQYPAINLSSENMAKIIPEDKNSIFKFHYMEFLMTVIIKTENWNFINISTITKIPIYMENGIM